jgi:hypothetical protein
MCEAHNSRRHKTRRHIDPAPLITLTPRAKASRTLLALTASDHAMFSAEKRRLCPREVSLVATEEAPPPAPHGGPALRRASTLHAAQDAGTAGIGGFLSACVRAAVAGSRWTSPSAPGMSVASIAATSAGGAAD